jgi:3-methyladenine DNA glycosylase Tag
MTSFESIYDRAVDRHGADDLAARFPTVLTAEELRVIPDDRVLAAMAQRVFSAGFRWSVIKAKWDGFEEAFHGFDVGHVANLDAAGIEALAQDTRIVRNRIKIVSTVKNAGYIQRVSAEHGSFGNWLAEWPLTDTMGLWAALKKGGDHLGGDSGAWILRLLGRDTFRLSGDVVQGLIEAGVVTKKPTTKAAAAATQAAFNAWTAESGLSQAAVSIVLACATGDVYGN